VEALATVSGIGKATVEREAAFAELVRQERDRAVAMAYHLTGGDRALAEDVAQEAFVRAYRALPRFRGEASLSTWFLRIVINRAQSARRREWLRQRMGALVGRGESSTPSGVDPGLRRRIGAALDRLTATQRAAFALVHLEGQSVAEAAEILGKPVGTVKSHLHRALLSLRQELGDIPREEP
jgi:RNA polymerase sigma-70 factor (ECF subfamily)